MVRSVINGEIIKGEIFTRFDIEKIIIQFYHVADVNFAIKKGAQIRLDIMVGDAVIPIMEKCEIAYVSLEIDGDIDSRVSQNNTVVTLFINYPE